MNRFARILISFLGLAVLGVFHTTNPAHGQEIDPSDYEARVERLRGTPPDAQPKIVVHARPYVRGETRHNCYEHGVTQPEDVVTELPAPAPGEEPLEYIVYILLAEFDTLGVTAVQFGTAYDMEQGAGIDVFGWQDCADLEFREEDWPLAGTGMLMTWDWIRNCQKTEPATAGFFLVRVHEPGEFRIIPRPVDNIASIVHCDTRAPNEIPREDLGKISFGGGKGHNPWKSDSEKAKE